MTGGLSNTQPRYHLQSFEKEWRKMKNVPLYVLDIFTSKRFAGNPASGWVHVSYSAGRCRREALTYDGKRYISGV